MSEEIQVWEASKENFQPLKKGRNPNVHRQAFAVLSNIEDNQSGNGKKRITFTKQ